MHNADEVEVALQPPPTISVACSTVYINEDEAIDHAVDHPELMHLLLH